MLDVKIDRDDPAHLHEQAATEIRRAIADGEANQATGSHPPATSPPVMGLNTNTVFRALRALRDEGLLEMRP